MIISLSGNVSVSIDGCKVQITVENQPLPPLTLYGDTEGTPVVSDCGKYVAYLTATVRPWLYVATFNGKSWEQEMISWTGHRVPQLAWESQDLWAPDLILTYKGGCQERYCAGRTGWAAA